MALPADKSLQLRIVASFVSLGIIWVITSVAIGVYQRDVGALIAFGLWSIPFLAAGWLVCGIPAIFLSARIRSFPLLALILGVAGSLVGGLIMLTPEVFVRWETPGVHWVPFAWTDLTGWPVLGATMGAASSLLYTWMLFPGTSDRKQKAEAP